MLDEGETPSLTTAADAQPSAAAELPRPGDLLLQRFLVRHLLGTGGSAAVFEAFDRVLGAPVALKVFKSAQAGQADRERLLRELRLARPGHPDLVTVHDAHALGPGLLLSMELVEGGTLRSALSARGALPVEDVVAIGRHVASALAFLEGRGLVHRDVKPANILLLPRGGAKLCDLGLLRPVAAGDTVTESVHLVGTPTYMAPEQALGGELTPAVDVYALGLTLWECLAGVQPFPGSNAVATLLARQRARVPSVRTLRRDCPEWLDRLVAQMVEPRPGDRPPAADVERALRSRRTGRRLRVRSWMALGAAAGALVLASLAVARVRETSPPAAARVETNDRSVEGFDAHGGRLFRHELASPIVSKELADLDGDGRDEIVVSAYEQSSAPEVPPAEVAVITPRGEILTRVSVEALLSPWSHRLRRQVTAVVRAADLDGDARPEVLVTYQHRGGYPSGLLVFWPRHRIWEWVLDHSGKLEDVETSPGRLRFLAVNNRLGMLLVAGEIGLHPPGGRSREARSGAMVQVGSTVSRSSSGASLLAYTFLGQQAPPGRPGPLTMRLLADRSVQVRGAYGDFDLDAAWNPARGPNAGSDLRRLRAGFVSGGLPWRGAAARDQARVETELQSARTSFAPLLLEAPYRAVLSLAFSDRFLETGQRRRAVELLSDAAVGRDEGVRCALANALALEGQRGAARSLLRELSENGFTPRADLDAPRALFRLAVVSRNRLDADAAVGLLTRRYDLKATQPMFPAVLWAWARLFWHETEEADASVRSCLYAPEGDAVAVLSGWRLGHVGMTDLEAMRRLAAERPEAAREAGLALAAAQLGLGRPDEARSTLEAEIRSLETDAAIDFWSGQLLALAQGLRAVALLRSGRAESALAAAREIAGGGDPDLLPAVLAREVLGLGRRSRS